MGLKLSLIPLPYACINGLNQTYNGIEIVKKLLQNIKLHCLNQTYNGIEI